MKHIFVLLSLVCLTGVRAESLSDLSFRELVELAEFERAVDESYRPVAPPPPRSFRPVRKLVFIPLHPGRPSWGIQRWRTSYSTPDCYGLVGDAEAACLYNGIQGNEASAQVVPPAIESVQTLEPVLAPQRAAGCYKKGGGGFYFNGKDAYCTTCPLLIMNHCGVPIEQFATSPLLPEGTEPVGARFDGRCQGCPG